LGPLFEDREKEPSGRDGNAVLKHHGYNLKHNFGHGGNHANEVFCMLNLLAFLFHGIQELTDEDYRRARAFFGRKDDFFGPVFRGKLRGIRPKRATP
jgi:hypothetical protein